MPILTQEQLQPEGLAFQREPVRPDDKSDLPYSNILAAQVSTENFIGAATVDYLMRGINRGSFDPDFDPFTPDHLHGYEDYASSFVNATNSEDAARIKKKIDFERQQKSLIEGTGWRGITAGLIAGVADPINFIPVGGELAASAKAGRLAEAGRTAFRVASAGGIAATAQELALHGVQESRTTQESALNIAAATLLSGVLGGAVGALSKPVETVADRAVKESKVLAEAADMAYGGSAGAAAVYDTTLAQETLKSAFGLEKTLKWQDPLLRTDHSPSIETRRIAQTLAENPLRFQKNAEGIASPLAVETRMREYEGPLASAQQEIERQFVQYRLGRNKQMGDLTKLGASDLIGKSEKLTLGQFADEVGKAMRRGDVHEIPEVAEAARFFRENVFDPPKNEAIGLKLLPEDVKPETAVSYLSRVYNVPKIVAERNQFETVVTDWLRDAQKSVQSGLEKAAAKTEKVQQFSSLTDAELSDIASEITDTLIGTTSGRIGYMPIPLVRGPLKERTFNIPDELIEPWLESDVRKISRYYTRTMSADIELTRAFGRADMADQISKIKSNYQNLRDGITDKGKLKKLNSQMLQDIKDIEGMRDRIRGTFGIPDDPSGITYRVGRVAKNLNFFRLLGGMTISAFSDLGSIISKTGIQRAMGDVIIPMIRNFKSFKMSAEEVKLLGNALDVVLDTRNMALWDVFDDFGHLSKFERGLEYMGQHYGMATLMSQWNAGLKQIAGVASQTRTLQIAEIVSKAPKSEIERLAFLGIDRRMAERIAKQFKKHGEKVDGNYWANTSKWTDKEARTVFRGAVSKDVNMMIVTPGQDKPLSWSTPLGSFLTQFKSFAVASTQRVMLAGLQQRDAAALNGALFMVGLGMLTYWAKTPNERLSEDPSVWIQEGIDRSGLTGWFFDANNLMEKMSGGKVGLSRITGQQASRYKSRDKIGAALGPTVDLFDKATSTLSNLSTGELSQSDIHNIRQMLPFQNLFYIRSLFDALESGVNETFNIPKRKH